MACKLPVANIENCIQFLESEVLGLRKKEVAVNPAEEVPACVPAKGTLLGEGVDKGRPGEGKNKVEAWV